MTIRNLALLTPSGFVRDGAAEEWRDFLESCGYRVKLMPHINCCADSDYTAGSAELRAADVNAALQDEKIDAIWCVRGGYGSAQILDLIDWETFRERRNFPVIGYSDVSALHLAMLKMGAGLPVAAPMAARLKEACNNRMTAAEINKLWRLPVREERVLAASNLTVAASLCGTGYLPDLSGMTLVLEDVGEAAYRLDRCFTQLQMNGFFRGIKRLYFGYFTGCPGYGEVLNRWRKTLGVEAIRVAYGHELPFRCLRADWDIEEQRGRGK